MNQDVSYVAQVTKEHYNPRYDHKARWLSYWYQIQEVLAFSPVAVAEIGIGNGLTTWYFRRNSIRVTTIDIDANLQPDIAASVASLPCGNGAFDVVLCAEVLEHLPFEDAQKALKELHRICRKGVVVSVPDARRTVVRMHIYMPFVGTKELLIKWDTRRPHVFDGQHYWEIGKRGYSMDTIRTAMSDAGFSIERDFVPVDVPTKHFFILTK